MFNMFKKSIEKDSNDEMVKKMQALYLQNQILLEQQKKEILKLKLKK